AWPTSQTLEADLQRDEEVEALRRQRPETTRAAACRPYGLLHRHELASRGSLPSSSTTRTWCGGSWAQSQNTTLTSAGVAPAAKLGTMIAATPSAIRRSASAQLGGLTPRVARSFHGQARSSGQMPRPARTAGSVRSSVSSQSTS